MLGLSRGLPITGLSLCFLARFLAQVTSPENPSQLWPWQLWARFKEMVTKRQGLALVWACPSGDPVTLAFVMVRHARLPGDTQVPPV